MGEGHRRGGVIYDVDGTLLDTNYLHVSAWWDAFRERGHDVACADIHRALGLSSDDLISRVLGEPDPSVSAAHSRYIAPYLGRMRPPPGAAELLRAAVRRDQRGRTTGRGGGRDVQGSCWPAGPAHRQRDRRS